MIPRLALFFRKDIELVKPCLWAFIVFHEFFSSILPNVRHAGFYYYALTLSEKVTPIL
jgi:hypothetical protein